MILTNEKRKECLILMNTWGFTYTELNAMKPGELDNWIDSHNSLMEEMHGDMEEPKEEPKEEPQCCSEGNCDECSCVNEDIKTKEKSIKEKLIEAIEKIIE